MSAESQYIAVVAIDFGTTYSGFAFAFNCNEFYSGIHLNKDWGYDQGFSSLKTPTSLLLRPDGAFDAFGYEADDKYTNFDSEEEKDYYYFQHFKMALHKSEDLNRSTVLKAANGKTMDALVVFSLSIRYLKDLAIDVIRGITGDQQYSSKDIQWVLTVPAIWRPAAKQFMREAAYKAGVASIDNPDQLMIALEPEAASLYCREKKMSEFIGETENANLSETLARPGTRYVLIDIGGGTLDVTAHEILLDGLVKEIHQVTGGACGGIKVNEEFVSLLETLCGAGSVSGFRTNHPSDWLTLMNDFEMKKRGKRASEGKTTRIWLPRNFLSILPTPGGRNDNLNERSANVLNIHGVKVLNNEYLSLESGTMKNLFQPVITEIVRHLKDLLKKNVFREVKALFLVGGFAESVILQKAIKKEFSNIYRILVPNSASIAVVQGAVMFGQKPHAIDSRLVSTTYGFKTYKPFKADLHPLEKMVDIEGCKFCKDCFVILAAENETVHVGQRKFMPNYSPLRKSQTAVRFDFFTSKNPDVKYITDDGVNSSIGYVSVESPDTSRGTDRKIDLSALFGGTEIKVTAFDVDSGNSATARLDFLSM